MCKFIDNLVTIAQALPGLVSNGCVYEIISPCINRHSKNIRITLHILFLVFNKHETYYFINVFIYIYKCILFIRHYLC